MSKSSTDKSHLNHLESITSLAITSTKEPIPSLAKLVKQKNDINVANGDGDVLLVAASYFGEIELVRLILQDDSIDINKTDSNGFSSIRWAMNNGHRNVVILLLEQPNLALKDLDLVEDLLNDSGNDTDITQLTMRHPSFDINMRSPEGDTLLMRTCRFDKDIETTKKLLKVPTIDINAVNSIGMSAYKYTTYYVDGAPLTHELLAADDRCNKDEPPLQTHLTASSNKKKHHHHNEREDNSNSLGLNLIQRTSLFISVLEKTTKSFTDSKLGGAPYWPRSQAEKRPVNIYRKPFALLAQVNFGKIKDMKKLDSYWPSSGLLQFYIDTTDPNMLFGCNLIDPLDRSGFRVVYHEEIDEESNAEETVSRYLGGISPFTSDEQGNILEFRIHDDFSGYETLEHSLLDPKEINNGDEVINEGQDEFVSKLGGFPNFLQSDPRDSVEDILLFQLVSNEYVRFGDAGIMNFFIHPEDLEKRDFTKVFFYWDSM